MRKLYRPVGVKELDLILNTGCRRYPKRLPTQPIFYPVLNQEYAAEIAKLWNTKDQFSGYAGFVTEFNSQIEIPIRISHAFYGEQYAGTGEKIEGDYVRQSYQPPFEMWVDN